VVKECLHFATTLPCPLTIPVADFKTHITGSTIAGVAYGYWGVTTQSMSLENGVIAGGLCSVSGMLPDLDSDSGVPLRETSMFAAAVIPMLMIERFRDLNLSQEGMVVAAMIMYVAIRFVVFEFFQRFTVHRGMWHSLPAAAIVGLLAYLAMPSMNEGVRIFKCIAVVVGFLVHLVLDEIWALDFRHGRFRIKKSFGTALKFFGEDLWINIAVYAALAFLIYIAWGDYEILDRIKQRVQLEQTYIAQPRSGTFPWERYLPWR
jgi:membrane-bound metal-dependent hydrolase YbcI (DUF457 family)